MDKYYKQFENCLQWEKPYCTDICPFHLNVLDFQEKLSSKRFNAAYTIFRNATGFPQIAAALCPEYCAKVCPLRDEADTAGTGAVQLNLLEQSCMALATRKEPMAYNLPAKGKKVAIVGAGISGMACALRLATKKYEVHIFEKADRIGGQLWDLLQPSIFFEDFDLQMKHEKYELHLNMEITAYSGEGKLVAKYDVNQNTNAVVIDPIQNSASLQFDAIYVATGRGGLDLGEDPPVFRGGSLTGKDALHALTGGLETAQTIDIYLQTGKPDHDIAPRPSKVVIDPDKLATKSPPIRAAAPTAAAALSSDATSDPFLFTEPEAVAEAGRCIRCGCDACKTYCDLCGYTGKWPLEMRDEIMTTVMASGSIVHKSPARKLINTCTQCMLCDDVCPGHIRLGEMIAESRKLLHKQNKMPLAYHGFWIGDMRFANGEYAAISKKAPAKKAEQSKTTYAFFPGCHLGAADTRYVELPYKWLLNKRPDTGLLLRCCGVPADRAGNEEMHTAEIGALKSDWVKLGRPTLITACPTCKKHIGESVPEIDMISLYEVLNEWGEGTDGKIQSDFIREQTSNLETFSVFDPCSARHDLSVQKAVRNLAAKSGVKTEEFPKGAKHGCCGFGGNASSADPAFAKYAAKERSALSKHPYITYCINCRDVFISEGKPVKHILDLLFEIDDVGDLPSLTMRRKNRMTLKENLLREIWGEETMNRPETSKYRLDIPSEIQSKMDRGQLIEEDIIKVLAESDRRNRRTYVVEKDTYRCYAELGFITCWIEYKYQPDIDAYEIVNVFSHRMKIEPENMWNGRKTNADL